MAASTGAQPLAGLRVLVTRPAHQAEALSSRLRALGAVPLELPVIEIVPQPEEVLRPAFDRLGDYDWIIFTSANTVTTVSPLLNPADMPAVVAIGDATASALEQLGYSVDLIPDDFVAESVLEALLATGVEGKRILLPQAEVARTTIPDGLRAAGALVDVVPVYQNRMPEQVDRSLLERVMSGEVDVVTFTSPSTVNNLLALTSGSLPASTRIACIGPVTASAAESAGLRVDIVAGTYSMSGLVDALVSDRRREQ